MEHECCLQRSVKLASRSPQRLVSSLTGALCYNPTGSLAGRKSMTKRKIMEQAESLSDEEASQVPGFLKLLRGLA